MLLLDRQLGEGIQLDAAIRHRRQFLVYSAADLGSDLGTAVDSTLRPLRSIPPFTRGGVNASFETVTASITALAFKRLILRRLSDTLR